MCPAYRAYPFGMRIKGSLTKGLLVALTLTLIPITAFSAQKITPGSTCKVLNQKIVYQNKTYTCIKSGNKLVWNKGVKVVTKTNASPTTRPKLDLYAGVSNPIQNTSRSEEFMIQTSDGRTRTYRFFKPGSIDSKIPAPLVLAFHGGLASARQFEANSGLSEFAESNGFYVVYPNGINASETQPGFQTWNAGDCCGPAVRNGVDDVAFMASLIKLIKDSYLIDPTRVFAMGHSNGGMLAYKLACELSDQVKGVGIQSASLGMDNCGSVNPVKLVHIHGTADKNFPIEGGLGSGIAGVPFRSARFALDVFASINKCNKTPEATRDIRNSEITIYEWNKCSTNVGMRYITVEGASHAWMGRTAVSSSAQSLVGTPYSNLDSTRAILSFLLGTAR